jgi:chitinase
MLAAKVDLAGVNVMAMDFGVPSAARDMPAAIAAAVTATHGQLAAVSARAGVPLDARAAWGALGVTVMIGQNDVDGERLTVAGARKVAAFAADHGLGRVSMWSLNRDAPCGATFAIIGTHSNTCSGVAQGKLAFSSVFARLSGRAGAHTAAGVPASGALVARATTVDDPARSPYPIWDPQRAYREGYKVVWHQAVYVAKWYSQGQTPDAENVLPANAAWRLVGPVLASDRAPVIPRLPAGTHPAWKAGAVYRAGDRVLFHGLPYQASWYTQGDAPDSAGANGSPSPWKPLYRIPGEPADG